MGIALSIRNFLYPNDVLIVIESLKNYPRIENILVLAFGFLFLIVSYKFSKTKHIIEISNNVVNLFEKNRSFNLCDIVNVSDVSSMSYGLNQYTVEVSLEKGESIKIVGFTDEALDFFNELKTKFDNDTLKN